MELANILYLEISIMCFIVFGYILIRMLSRPDRQVLPRLLRGLVVCFLLVNLSDAAQQLVGTRVSAHAVLLNNIFNCSYFVFMELSAYLWFLYAEHLQKTPVVRNLRRALLAGTPVFVICIMSLLSPITGWIFSIDALNIYHRGPLHLWQVGVGAAYLLFTALKALIRGLNRRYFVLRRDLLLVSWFSILPALSILAQTLIGNKVPVQCAGLTLTAIFVYDTSQESRITIDTLTKISNRDQVLRFISRKLSFHTPGRQLCVMMMDLDDFKSINDRYGHLAGDAALVRLADVLKTAVPRDFIIGRYGGDEFILAGEAESEDQIDWVRLSIRETLAIFNREANSPFNFTVSMGYTFAVANDTVADLINRADQELYRAKAKRHKGR